MKKMIKDLPKFLTQPKIICPKHNKRASSFCVTCDEIICLDSLCGSQHIFHTIENIDEFVNGKVIPCLNSIMEINNLQENNSKYVSALNVIKNNLKSHAIDEKKKIDTSYKNITSTLQKIYSAYLSQVDLFTNSVKNQIKFLLNQILNKNFTNNPNEMSDKDREIYKFNMKLSQIIEKVENEPNPETQFILEIGKEISEISIKVMSYKESMHNNCFNSDNIEKSINNLKEIAKSTYNSIKNKGCFFFDSLISPLNTTIEEVTKEKETLKLQIEKCFSIFPSKQVKISTVKIPVNDIKSFDIDLDIFSKDLQAQINCYRQSPKKLIPLINSITLPRGAKIFNSIKKDKLDYIQSYLNNTTPSRILDWDNDLSNSAEDYFKLSKNKISQNYNELNAQIKNILSGSYYSENSFLMAIKTIGLEKEKADIEEVIENILLEEDFWDFSGNENIVFSKRFNLIGICAVPFENSSNKINLIINLGFFNQNE